MRDFDEEPALLAALDAAARRGVERRRHVQRRRLRPAAARDALRARRAAAGRPTLSHLDLLRAGAARVDGAGSPTAGWPRSRASVLGFARDDDVPGALIPPLYFDYLRRGGRAAPARVRAQPPRRPVAGRADRLVRRGRSARGRRRCVRRSWPGSAASGSRSTSSAALACYRSALGARPARAGAAAGRGCGWRWWEKRARALGGGVRPVGGGARATRASIRGRGRRWPSSTSTARGICRRRARVVADALDQARSAGAAPRVLDGFAYRLARLERRLNRPGLDPATT